MDITSLFQFDKKLYNTLLIPKIIYTVLTHRKALVRAKNNVALKDTEKGNTLYICGNGPSLNKVDIRDIHDDYLVLNDFYRFSQKDDTHPPKYYMILDEGYLNNKLADRYQGVFDPGFETTYILNGLLMDRVNNDYPQLSNVFYFCPWGKLYSSKNEFDLAKIHGRPWNVVAEAILFAIYVGYSDIRLLGCDYSVFASNAHFYSQTQSHAKLRDMLYKYCYTTEVHYEIAKYAKKKGVKITNMTRDTLLDAYEIDMNSPY